MEGVRGVAVSRKRAPYKSTHNSGDAVHLAANYNVHSLNTQPNILRSSTCQPHWNPSPLTTQTALAQGAGAHSLRSGCARLQKSPPDRWLHRTSLTNVTISHLTLRPVSVSAPRHHHLLSDAHVFQPSAIELFRLLIPDNAIKVCFAVSNPLQIPRSEITISNIIVNLFTYLPQELRWAYSTVSKQARPLTQHNDSTCTMYMQSAPL